MKELSISLFILCLIINCDTKKSKADQLLNLLAIPKSIEPIKISLVGDSLAAWSEGFRLKTILRDGYIISIFAQPGADTEFWLANYIKPSTTPAQIIIISLGTNDIGYGKGREYPARLRELIDLSIRKPGVNQIFITTIPLSNQDKLWNEIKSANQAIRQIQGIKIVEWESALNPNESYSPFYPMIDPIHPKEEGYEILGQILANRILYPL